MASLFKRLRARLGDKAEDDQPPQPPKVEVKEARVTVRDLLRNKTVENIMVPMRDVTVLDLASTPEELTATVSETAHTRLPVIEEGAIKGLAHGKDILKKLISSKRSEVSAELVRETIRKTETVPENMALADLLEEFRAVRKHMAFVVDEFGNNAGIVTLEDILEELVGEIHDEHDPDEPVMFVEQGSGSYRVQAAMTIDDFNAEFKVKIDSETTETIGGHVVDVFGRIPDEGEEIDLEDTLHCRVVEVEGPRLVVLLITRKEPEAEGADQQEDQRGA